MQNVVFWREIVLSKVIGYSSSVKLCEHHRYFLIVLNMYNLTVDLVVRMMFCVFI